LKFFYPKPYYDNNNRGHIFPLLKSLLKTENLCFEDFYLTTDIETANYVIIPMSWNYYHDKKMVNTIMAFYKNIPKEIQVISFVFGDSGVAIPKKFKGFVFRVSGRKTKLPENHIGMPVFIEDPILKFYNNDKTVLSKPILNTPVVGFCGQAVGLGIQTLKEYLKRIVKNSLSYSGFSIKDPDALMSTTYFRWNILRRIKNSSTIKSNFILRHLYRAGVKTHKDKHPTTLEFYDNIKNSYYTVCMRGAGNFSRRFYETLALGRIPVFVDTDCLLPLDGIIDWKQHVVWVDYSERHLVVKKIEEFHKQHSSKSLNNLFQENRNLWENQLQLYSFFKLFFDEHK